MPKRLLPPLLLAGLGLVFFADLVVHPAQVLYSPYSDILAEHVPAKRFLVRSWQETGEVPLWCPYRFGGEPFIHDIQVAAFYPPHWLLYPLPEEWIGVALSWLIVAHVILAGWCMYAYARDQGLGVAGALVAGCGYMFAGKWLLHLLGGGHYITIGLAWVPLVLLCLERAIRRGSFVWATTAGAVFGLVALGTQPQWTFYAGLFLALWTLGTALESTSRRTALLCWLGCGLWTALLGTALAAVQLLPTLEAAGQSTRSAGVDAEDLLMGGVRALLFLVGPALTADPPCLAWEDRGGFGLLWLAAAVLAPVLCRGRVRYQAGVCVALALFAFGGALLFQGLPGFRLFRQHARILMVAALPVAYLAGVTTHTLLTTEWSPERCRRCRHVLARVVAGFVILVIGLAVGVCFQHESLHFHVYWFTLLATVPAAFWLLGGGLAGRRGWALAWGAVLLTDLWGLTWPLVAVRPEAEIYARSRCVDYLIEHNGEPGRVLDRDVGPSDTPLGAGAPLAMLGRLESLRGYNPLDQLRYKEYLLFLGNEDRPLRPLDGALTFPIISNFPIENRQLLDLLGVRYLLVPEDQPPPVFEPVPADAGDTSMPADSTLARAGWLRVAEDEHPLGYNFVVGGMRSLPRYVVWQNTQAFPRAFVVPHAAALPERAQALAALKTTEFRDTVLLEGYEPDGKATAPTGGPHVAVIEQYQPNRVTVRVTGTVAGWLVLTDAWYPGWTCRVDGVPAALYRANYLFRAVAVPAGEHEVTFAFAPLSYRWGWLLSVGTLAGILGLLSLALVLRGLRRRSDCSRSHAERANAVPAPTNN